MHDVTLSISSSTPVYPGDPATTIVRVADLAKGDTAAVSLVSMSSHLGTHVDAPCHVLAGAHGVDEIPLDALIGEAVLVSLDASKGVTARDLEGASVPPGTKRLLLKTRRHFWASQPVVQASTEPFLQEDAARWLVDRQIRLVGVDTLSVDRLGSGSLVAHRMLLEAGVVILESLQLGAVSPGEYVLICLPLKLKGCDGAPARVVLLQEPEPVEKRANTPNRVTLSPPEADEGSGVGWPPPAPDSSSRLHRDSE